MIFADRHPIEVDGRVTSAHRAGDWPIGSAMLQTASSLPGGRRYHEATDEEWVVALEPLAAAGFTGFELSSDWVDPTLCDTGRRRRLMEVAQSHLGLRCIGILASRRSIADVAHREQNVAFTHALLDAAADLSVAVVSTGLFQITGRPATSTWFWNAPGGSSGLPEDEWDYAVREFRSFAEPAEAVGVS
ncbi:MAG: hypothetical protein VB036_09295, partial [Propionicimonas sp.]|nr:hypothetical protein [Propionicimonas sp.]